MFIFDILVAQAHENNNAINTQRNNRAEQMTAPEQPIAHKKKDSSEEAPSKTGMHIKGILGVLMSIPMVLTNGALLTSSLSPKLIGLLGISSTLIFAGLALYLLFSAYSDYTKIQEMEEKNNPAAPASNHRTPQEQPPHGASVTLA